MFRGSKKQFRKYKLLRLSQQKISRFHFVLIYFTKYWCINECWKHKLFILFLNNIHSLKPMECKLKLYFHIPEIMLYSACCRCIYNCCYYFLSFDKSIILFFVILKIFIMGFYDHKWHILSKTYVSRFVFYMNAFAN